MRLPPQLPPPPCPSLAARGWGCARAMGRRPLVLPPPLNPPRSRGRAKGRGKCLPLGKRGALVLRRLSGFSSPVPGELSAFSAQLSAACPAWVAPPLAPSLHPALVTGISSSTSVITPSDQYLVYRHGKPDCRELRQRAPVWRHCLGGETNCERTQSSGRI